MSGETTVIRGKTWDETQGEKVDLAKLNLTAKPSVSVNEQAICTRELGDGCVTADKLSEDILNQIEAAGTISDGAICTLQIGNGCVTFVKLNQNVLDVIVRRAVILSTVGSFMKYSTDGGITEEVTPANFFNTFGAAKAGEATAATKAVALGNPITDIGRITGSVMSAFNFTGQGTANILGHFNFVKISDTWTSSCTGMIIHDTAASAGGTREGFAKTGNTSVASGNFTDGANTFTITVSITGSTLTATHTQSGTSLDAQEINVALITQ